MQTKPILTLLIVLFGIGFLMMVSMVGSVSAQIDPTSQYQTVEAAVAQRLNATATAQAALASTATIQAAFETAVAATAQAQQTVMMDATLVESMIQTAVMDSIQATQQAEFAVTMQAIGVDIDYVITGNAAWTPLERDFNGVTMVFVPAGCFKFGNAYVRNSSEVCFEPFWLDKTEVTQSQFIAHSEDELDSYHGHYEFFGDNHPVQVSLWIVSTQDYCKQRGGRLPSEAEWEYAVRGPSELLYPWGNEAIEYENPSEYREVGSNPIDVSWVGAMDMGGNGSEWATSSIYPQTYVYTNIEGETTEYELFNVPMPDGTFKEMALINKGRQSSDFIDPTNPEIGLITWMGSWRMLQQVYVLDDSLENPNVYLVGRGSESSNSLYRYDFGNRNSFRCVLSG